MLFKQAQIDKYLKKPDMSVKCFVIYGSNEGLVAEYVKNLTQTVCKDVYDPFCVAYLNEVEEGSLAAEYNSRSLMGGRRVVVVKDAPDGMAKYLKNLLDTSNSDTLIIVSSLSFSKNSAMVKLASDRYDMALITCYEDRDEDIYATARAVFVENGITINPEALQILCSRLSNDRKTNLGEIDKLITYIGDRRNIAVDDICNVVVDSASMDTDDVCYCAASGQTEKAQQAFVKLINEGAEPVSIVRALSYHFQKIISCLALMEEGGSLDDAIRKMRIIFFRTASFKRQVTIWNKEKAFHALELLYRCEKDCKTTGMPAEEVLSYTILQVSSAAAKAVR